MAGYRHRGEAPRRVDLPEPGHFELRMVRGGPILGARITYEGGAYQAFFNGQAAGPPHPDPVRAVGVFTIWHSGRRISPQEYAFRVAQRDWAVKHDPAHPAANPSTPIDLATRPPVF